MFWKSWARGRLSNSIFQVEPQINQKLDFPLCVGHNCQYGRHAITLNIAICNFCQFSENYISNSFHRILYIWIYNGVTRLVFAGAFGHIFFYGTIGLLATYWTAEDTGAASKNIFFVTFPKLLWSPFWERWSCKPWTSKSPMWPISISASSSSLWSCWCCWPGWRHSGGWPPCALLTSSTSSLAPPSSLLSVSPSWSSPSSSYHRNCSCLCSFVTTRASWGASVA